MEIVLWLACGVTTIIAAVLASQEQAMAVHRTAAVGALFILGGALQRRLPRLWRRLRRFRRPCRLRLVTKAWRAVVAPNVVQWIGHLVVFEATVGALILSGGRRTQLRYIGVIGFYLALWLFGGFQLVWW